MSGSSRSNIAFVGKGGSGKSTISGTYARLLARSGRPVLAIDSDPLPGMPYALGIPVDDGTIPDDVVTEGPDDGPRWVLGPGWTAESVVERHAAMCPDGVRYLQFGNVHGHISTLQRSQYAWSQVVRELEPDRWNLVGDLPGGTRQAMSGWAKYADIVCIVVEPTTKSLHSASRLLTLTTATWGPETVVLVANKVSDPSDVTRIEERLGHEVSASVPLAPDVLDGDRLGRAPLDAAPDGPFVDAVRSLTERIGAMG